MFCGEWKRIQCLEEIDTDSFLASVAIGF